MLRLFDAGLRNGVRGRGSRREPRITDPPLFFGVMRADPGVTGAERVAKGLMGVLKVRFRRGGVRVREASGEGDIIGAVEGGADVEGVELKRPALGEAVSQS